MSNKMNTTLAALQSANPTYRVYHDLTPDIIDVFFTPDGDDFETYEWHEMSSMYVNVNNMNDAYQLGDDGQLIHHTDI